MSIVFIGVGAKKTRFVGGNLNVRVSSYVKNSTVVGFSDGSEQRRQLFYSFFSVGHVSDSGKTVVADLEQKVVDCVFGLKVVEVETAKMRGSNSIPVF